MRNLVTPNRAAPRHAAGVSPGWLQSQCACGGTASLSGSCVDCHRKKTLGLQTQLTMGATDDVYEREADHVAEQVVAGAAAGGPGSVAPRIQRLATALGTQHTEAAPASVQATLDASGNALEPRLRQDMEQRFGHDFSQVRVHADAHANQSAHEVNANAYTAGHHIAFAAGRYAPQTSAGRQLLAHELTHVVQQGASHVLGLQCDAKGKAPSVPKVVPPVAPNKAQARIINDARRGAAIRTQRAMFRANGIEGTQALTEAQALARIKFDWANPNMEQISDVLRGMGGGVITADAMVAGPGDPECGSRAGYVRGSRPPIVLCPAFFAKSTTNESRIRTMVHEMAHLQHIGSADVAESYFPTFDCDSPGAFESADSWANYVNCLSGQTPDANVITVPVPGRKPPSQKKGGAK